MSAIEDRYKAAYRQEFEAMKRAGEDDRAKGVADHYRALYGEDLEPEEDKPETTRAEKPPEKAVPAKPAPARKPSQK